MLGFGVLRSCAGFWGENRRGATGSGLNPYPLFIRLLELLAGCLGRRFAVALG